MSIGRFMGMIGALIRDPNAGKYLVLRRSVEKDVGAGIWECVTGRVDQGEGFPEAMQREVKEELGVQVRPDFIIRTSHFYRGEAVPENEMIGVMYACSLDDPEAIQMSWEHSEARWVTAEEAAENLSGNDWLVTLIQQAEKIRTLMPKGLKDHYRRVESVNLSQDP